MRPPGPGGSWRDWEDDLVTPCHRRETGQGYSSVYGRMKWDEPAPTVCNPKKVYMVHPDECRNISLAEAAALQGFPPDYVWHGNEGAIAQMIANAMPAEMAAAVAGAIA